MREKNQTQTDPSKRRIILWRKYVFLSSIGWSIFAIPRRYQKKRKKREREKRKEEREGKKEKKERNFPGIIIPYDKTSADITLSGRNVLANARISSEKERCERRLPPGAILVTQIILLHVTSTERKKRKSEWNKAREREKEREGERERERVKEKRKRKRRTWQSCFSAFRVSVPRCCLVWKYVIVSPR